MRGEKDRVIFDTNIWISYLISNDFLFLDKLISDRLIILVFSTELLEEFYEVASRSKFKSYFSVDDLEALIKTLLTFY